MSSFKNAYHAPMHKERSQPLGRKKFGFLEKKKDYKKRADDYKRKKKRIKALQIKAENKNPDEFYFNMINLKTKDGIVKLNKGQKYTNEQMKKLKSQDLSYLTNQHTSELKKIDKLSSNLHGIDNQSKPNTHTIFVEDEEELKNFDPVEFFDTTEETVNNSTNRLTKSQLESTDIIKNQISDKDMAKIFREREKSYRELSEREKREKTISKLTNNLQTQKNLMGKGKRVKIKSKDGKGNGPVFKWASQRKK